MDKLACHRSQDKTGDKSSNLRFGSEIRLCGDMHMHTTYSDGTYTPGSVVNLAADSGLSVVAITDHDTVNGIEEALETGASLNIEVIPGIELSAVSGDREIHILGYFIDYRDPEFLNFLKYFRAERIKRARKIMERLIELDIPVEIDDVLENLRDASVGRPHIAAAVVETGKVRSYLEVFNKYIGYGCPAYVEKVRLEVQDAVNLISRVGGLSFLAHPNDAILDDLLPELVEAGLDGIETVHPSITNARSREYHGLAVKYNLLECGGSDFHGGKRNDENNIGRYGVSLEFIDAMRKKLVA